MPRRSANPCSHERVTTSSSTLPVIYSGPDNTLLIEAIIREVQKYDADLHYLRVFVTQDFEQADKERFHKLYFELGQSLASEQSGYRLLNYEVKMKSTHVYQITFVCRYVGIMDIAFPYPPTRGVLSRLLKLL